MPGPVQRDSWSRCESPSMLYDVVRNPNTLYQPPKVIPSCERKDVLETKQQKLNREMFDRLHTQPMRLPHHSYVAVAQVGKYLFMAIMVPTYIFLYGIPKWLLVNALPQFFIMVKSEYQKIGKFFTELSSQVIDVMKGMIQQMVGDSIRILREKSEQVFNFLHKKIVKGVKRTWELMIKPLVYINKINNKVAIFFGKLKKIIQDSLKKIFYKLIIKTKIITKFLTKPLLLLIDKTIHQIRETFHTIIWKPLTEWIKPKYIKFVAKINVINKKIKQTIAVLGKIVKKSFVRIAKPIQKTIKIVQTAVEQTLIKVSEKLNQIFQPIITWLTPRFEAIALMIRNRRAKVFDKLKKVRKKIFRYLTAVSTPIKSIISNISEKGGKLLKNIFKKLTKHRIKGTGKFFDSFRKMGNFFVSKGKNFKIIIVQFVKDILTSIAGHLYSFLIWLKIFLMKAPGRILKLIKYLWSATLHTVRNIGHGMRVGLALIIALFRYWMMHVRNYASNLKL